MRFLCEVPSNNKKKVFDKSESAICRYLISNKRVKPIINSVENKKIDCFPSKYSFPILKFV